MVRVNKMMIIALLAVFLLVFAGCASLGNLGGGGEASSYGGGTNYVKTSTPAPAYAYDSSSGTSGQSAGSGMVIKTANAVVEVQAGTLEDKYARLKDRITSLGGQISSADYYETDSSKNYNIVMKVKPADFESLSGIFRSLGTVKSMNSNVQDVGEQYTDLEIRISNLQKQRESLLALLDRNGTLSDVLAVENELNRVQTQIEIYQSQKLDLDRRIGMSTVAVNLYEEAPAVDKNVLLPIKEVGNIFLGALGFAILAISAIAGFGIPVAIALGVLYLAYLKFFKKKDASREAKEKKK
ncbi:MAG: DUF4349 domain-containing protein [Candidatus Micrarchaeia archaeon]